MQNGFKSPEGGVKNTKSSKSKSPPKLGNPTTLNSSLSSLSTTSSDESPLMMIKSSSSDDSDDDQEQSTAAQSNTNHSTASLTSEMESELENSSHHLSPTARQQRRNRNRQAHPPPPPLLMGEDDDDSSSSSSSSSASDDDSSENSDIAAISAILLGRGKPSARAAKSASSQHERLLTSRHERIEEPERYRASPESLPGKKVKAFKVEPFETAIAKRSLTSRKDKTRPPSALFPQESPFSPESSSSSSFEPTIQAKLLEVAISILKTAPPLSPSSSSESSAIEIESPLSPESFLEPAMQKVELKPFEKAIYVHASSSSSSPEPTTIQEEWERTIPSVKHKSSSSMISNEKPIPLRAVVPPESPFSPESSPEATTQSEFKPSETAIVEVHESSESSSPEPTTIQEWERTKPSVKQKSSTMIPEGRKPSEFPSSPGSSPEATFQKFKFNAYERLSLPELQSPESASSSAGDDSTIRMMTPIVTSKKLLAMECPESPKIVLSPGESTIHPFQMTPFEEPSVRKKSMTRTAAQSDHAQSHISPSPPSAASLPEDDAIHSPAPQGPGKQPASWKQQQQQQEPRQNSPQCASPLPEDGDINSPAPWGPGKLAPWKYQQQPVRHASPSKRISLMAEDDDINSPAPWIGTGKTLLSPTKNGRKLGISLPKPAMIVWAELEPEQEPSPVDSSSETSSSAASIKCTACLPWGFKNEDFGDLEHIPARPTPPRTRKDDKNGAGGENVGLLTSRRGRDASHHSRGSAMFLDEMHSSWNLPIRTDLESDWVNPTKAVDLDPSRPIFADLNKDITKKTQAAGNNKSEPHVDAHQPIPREITVFDGYKASTASDAAVDRTRSAGAPKHMDITTSSGEGAQISSSSAPIAENNVSGPASAKYQNGESLGQAITPVPEASSTKVVHHEAQGKPEPESIWSATVQTHAAPPPLRGPLRQKSTGAKGRVASALAKPERTDDAAGALLIGTQKLKRAPGQQEVAGVASLGSQVKLEEHAVRSAIIEENIEGVDRSIETQRVSRANSNQEKASSPSTGANLGRAVATRDVGISPPDDGMSDVPDDEKMSRSPCAVNTGSAEGSASIIGPPAVSRDQHAVEKDGPFGDAVLPFASKKNALTVGDMMDLEEMEAQRLESADGLVKSSPRVIPQWEETIPFDAIEDTSLRGKPANANEQEMLPDETKVKKSSAQPRISRLKLLCLCFLLCIIPAVVAVLVVIFFRNDDNDAAADSSISLRDTLRPSPNPSADTVFSPTISPAASPDAPTLPPILPTSDPLLQLLSVSSADGGAALYDSSTPQHQALQWIRTQNANNMFEEPIILQRYALAVLYYSTGGNNWRRSRTWLTSANECEWFLAVSGMSACDSAGNIVTIRLANNGLSGSLPPELAILAPSLEGIQLSGNQLCGELPTAFSALTKLSVLELSSNQLTGTIPEQYGRLTELTRLVLNNNSLRNSIPAQLGQLTALTVFDLSSNQLTGEIPTQFGSFLELRSLSLFGNPITGPIPFQLVNLSKLTELYFDSTSLSPSLPEGLCRLQFLAEFWSDCAEIGGCRCCTSCCVDNLSCSPQL